MSEAPRCNELRATSRPTHYRRVVIAHGACWKYRVNHYGNEKNYEIPMNIVMCRMLKGMFQPLNNQNNQDNLLPWQQKGRIS